jgi:hypothetical protein
MSYHLRLTDLMCRWLCRCNCILNMSGPWFILYWTSIGYHQHDRWWEWWTLHVTLVSTLGDVLVYITHVYPLGQHDLPFKEDVLDIQLVLWRVILIAFHPSKDILDVWYHLKELLCWTWFHLHITFEGVDNSILSSMVTHFMLKVTNHLVTWWWLTLFHLAVELIYEMVLGDIDLPNRVVDGDYLLYFMLRCWRKSKISLVHA